MGTCRRAITTVLKCLPSALVAHLAMWTYQSYKLVDPQTQMLKRLNQQSFSPSEYGVHVHN